MAKIEETPVGRGLQTPPPRPIKEVVGTTIKHYRVDERLGAGGMGEVYRGEDTRLGRPVALKFLPASLKSDPESRARLLNEARAASMLRSPNIAVTYDIGEDSGTDFIVMEYVDGELLSSRVTRGAVPVREVVEIGIQVADALDEAHSRGIIHRDIKSANLMRTERGLVKVLDFGLAKFISNATARDVTQAQMTMAGIVVGTVSYMAPEQALGRAIDHRVDLFSLGVVLFELMTGRMPFEGTTPTEIIDHILHEVPVPPSRYTAAVPASLDAIIARALEKDPAFRYQHASEIARDLGQVADEIDNATAGRISRTTTAVTAGPLEKSVAVMTFSNITREPADDWIGTGIAETVSSDLKNIHGLTIIGRARVYDALRNLSTDAHLKDSLAIDIGRRLGATWVVVGGYQRMASVIRITATVVEIATGAVTRTVKVDGKIDDIFELQDKIVFEVSQGLNVALRGTEIADIERQETNSVAAYESYARGMMNLRQATRDSIDRAIAAFGDATKHDPEYARAWAALGGAYGLKGNFLSMPEMVNEAIDLERRAVALDPDLADAHLWLGGSLLSTGRTDEAIAEIREALRLEPENGQAYQSLARAYWVGIGDFKSAIPLFERAIDLNPEAGYSYLQLSLLLAWDGQLDRAEEISRRAVELQEQYISGNLGLQIVGAHARLGYIYYLRADYAGAIREYEREMAFIGAGDHALRDRTLLELNVKIGAAYLREGRTEDAERHFARALKSFDSRVANGADDPFTRYYVASLHALRGDREHALDSLERVARTLPKLTAARARVDIDLESLRDESRFQALTR
ncbi:MAG TPA: protein kinase [Vicinamibacterales bacterium]|nr:protein kinase [Vicinamibacterales bacterium]